MSVAEILFWFCLGGGCLLLGTFFLWQWWRRSHSLWWLVGVVLAPVLILVTVALCRGQHELCVKFILGTVALNVAVSGGISLVTGLRLPRQAQLFWVWLGLGLAGCCVATRCSQIGVMTGISLMIVGLVALWHGCRLSAPKMSKINIFCQALGWANVILVNLGLGLLAVITGGIRLTQSVVMVVLPWLVGMVVVAVVSLWMSKKTARVCGGLIVLLFLVLLWFSFGS